MRFGLAGVFHESHSLARPHTGLEQFSRYSGEQMLANWRGTRTELGGEIAAAAQFGFDLVPLLYFTATPSGPVTQEAFGTILEAITRGIQDAGPLDGMLLVLHGAMVVEGQADAEGLLLQQLKGMMGDRPVVSTLDLHGNISERMVAFSDLLVGYDTYPHVDAYERGLEAGMGLLRIARGEIRPAAALEKPLLLPVPQSMPTASQPMQDLLQLAHEMETDPRVVNATVAGGFAYSDEKRAGMSLLVTTNGDPDLARSLARQLAALAWERRGQFLIRNVAPATAVQRAIGAQQTPVVLVDIADNVGAGTPADGTVLLEELLRQGATGALVTICDPESVSQCDAAGEGAEVALRVGGKTDPYHGGAVPVRGQVRLLADGRFRHVGPYMTGQLADMGRTAVVEAGGVELVLTSRRQAPWDRGYLQVLGIDPAVKRIIVAKAAIAWQSAFGDIAREVITVDTPGITTARLETLPLYQIRRPIFPLDPV
jgi:microcystin degradation protein MlrC